MKASLSSADTIPFLLSSTVLFLILWISLKRYVTQKGPIPAARILINFNSQAYSIFSLLLGLGILSSFAGQPLRPESSLSTLCAYLFHLSKFYEYVDVFLLVAQGINIAKHMAFHHLTTPFYTFFRVLPRAPQWQVFAVLNCWHHFLMYAYFGGATVFRPVLPWTGYAQLVAGITVDVAYFLRHGVSGGGKEVLGRVIGVLLLSTYALLFTEELMTEREERRPKRRQQ